MDYPAITVHPKPILPYNYLGDSTVDDPPSAQLVQQLRIDSLSLHQVNADTFPWDACQAKYLRYLKLDFCQLNTTPKAFEQFRQLQTLILHHQNIANFSNLISQLPKLRTLHFNYQKLELPNDLVWPKQLKDVSFSFCRLQQLPPALAALPITTLSLKDNEFTQLNLQAFRHLKSLALSDNDYLEQLPALHHLPQLKTLKIAWLPSITTWQDSIFSPITKLEHLDISGLKDVLPSSFDLLKQLKSLQADFTRVGQDKIAALLQFKQLQTLSLQGNCLATLPTSFGQLKSLQHLNLQNNGLDSFPKVLYQLPHLKSLWIGNAYYYPSKPRDCQSHNSLRILPNDIAQLKHLRYLSLKKLPIKQLPAAICNLKKLRVLDLSGSSIEQLPDNMYLLQNLEVLYLQGTPIKALPANFKQLPKLKAIHVDGGKILNLHQACPANCTIEQYYYQPYFDTKNRLQ